MKIRVYISADPDTSQLFENVDKVIDGVNDASGISNERNPKLVLLRKTGKKEDLVNGFNYKVGEQDKMETIAVFNLWTFWKLLPDDRKGRILCTTCEDKKKWKSDKDIQMETPEILEKRMNQKRKDYSDDESTQILIEEKHKPDKDAKYK